MLCLQQQTDLVVRLALFLLILSARRGMAEKSSAGFGAKRNFFARFQSVSGTCRMGWQTNLPPEAVNQEHLVLATAPRVVSTPRAARWMPGPGADNAAPRAPIPVGWLWGSTDPQGGGSVPNHTAWTSSFRVSC